MLLQGDLTCTCWGFRAWAQGTSPACLASELVGCRVAPYQGYSAWALVPRLCGCCPPQVKEPLLVRDVLYACQGINGKYTAYQVRPLGGNGADSDTARLGMRRSYGDRARLGLIGSCVLLQIHVSGADLSALD